MAQSLSESPFEVLLRRAKSHGRPVILDGGVGTELDNRGVDTRSSLRSGLAPLTEPSLLKAIHAEYVAAGAEILTASTFRTTQRAYKGAGEPSNRWREAVRAAVSIARSAVGTRAGVSIIGGCCGSTPAHIRALSDHFM
ncbi:MAG: homocysteine S-methyltransferase family protein [Proteobacteria bacterium]|nr:homocysteine S-methyltransferase family protein [Pseudomonadota bacterium]